MPDFTVEIWRDGGPGVGTLVMRSFSAEGIFMDFTRDSPAAGEHTYGVYVKTDIASSLVGFARLSALLTHR